MANLKKQLSMFFGDDLVPVVLDCQQTAASWARTTASIQDSCAFVGCDMNTYSSENESIR
jgi:hypothetical protein